MSFLDSLGDFVSDLPIIGEFVGDTASSLSKDQQKRYEQLRQGYLDQLGPNRQARMQALQQTMNLFQPMANTMQQHTGQNYDFSGLFQDPMQSFDEALKANQNEREMQSGVNFLNTAEQKFGPMWDKFGMGDMQNSLDEARRKLQNKSASATARPKTQAARRSGS